MNDEAENLRIFLGLPIEAQDGDDLRARFETGSSQIREGLRWTDPTQYHLTIRFIPSFPSASIPALVDALAKLILPKPSLTALQISDFPKPGGPGIAVNVRLSVELAKIFHLVSGVLNAFGMKFENHSFRPHITLAKTRKNQKNIQVDKIVLKNYEINVDKLVLYQSLLEESGSRYISLHSFPLRKNPQ